VEAIQQSTACAVWRALEAEPSDVVREVAEADRRDQREQARGSEMQDGTYCGIQRELVEGVDRKCNVRAQTEALTHVERPATQ
jgi:hypothetical protein